MSQQVKLIASCLCMLLLLQLAETSTTQVYSWGKNNYGEAGHDAIQLKLSAMNLLSNNYLTKMFKTNPELSYQKAFGSTLGVKVDLPHIINGYFYNYYVVNFFNNETNNFLGQHVFTCGNNQKGVSGIHEQAPPFMTSELQSIYVYRNDQRIYNPMTSKNISHIQCAISCVACMQDGSVYWKNGTSKEWSLVTLSLNQLDPSDDKCKMVAVAGDLTKGETMFILTRGGFVHSWGYYNSGTRGNGVDGEITWTPQIIPNVTNITYINGLADYVMLSYSIKTSVTFVDNAGKMYMMGLNTNGFGTGIIDNAVYSTPVQVPIPAIDGKVIKTCYGNQHVLVLTDLHRVYSFGANGNGQSDPGNVPIAVTTPLNLTSLFTNPVVDCSCSRYASMCIDDQNNVYSWGASDEKGTENSGFQLISGGVTVLKASLLTNNGYIIADDLWYYFGFNDLGQSCIGDLKVVPKPTKITDAPIIGNNPQIKAGYGCTLLLDIAYPTFNNKLWGNCTYGMDLNQNAVFAPVFAVTPIDSSIFLNENLTNFALTDSHVLIMNKASGQGYSYGVGSSYQLGDGTTSTSTTLVNLNLQGDFPSLIKSVAAGFDHSLLLLRNGMLYGVGASYEGQIPGYGSYLSSITGIDLTSLYNDGHTISEIYAGHKLTFILTRNGTVYGCGINQKNEISTAKALLEPSLTLIPLDYTYPVKKLAVGSHVIALRTDGSVAMFKNGGFLLNIPEIVIDIFASHTAYYFITKSGNVYAMGDNEFYQTSLSEGKVYVSSPTLLYTKSHFDGLVPYMIAPGLSFASALAKSDWYCGGIASTNSSVCSGNGVCDDTGKCTCTNGYYGDNCEITTCNGTFSNQTTTVCGGRGKCKSINQCECNTGYSGSLCENFQCFGLASNATNVCNGVGSCINLNTCSCNSFYFGNNCQYNKCYGGSVELSLPSLASRLCIKINKFLK